MEPRLPRFHRAFTAAPFQLTDRDRDIIWQVNRYRFLRSPQIVALAGGSPQQIVRRLQLLFHHGYLERPRCQLDYYYKTGSRPIAYGLGDKGADLLRIQSVEGILSRPSETNDKVTRIYLEHALSVSDVMVAIELACRQDGNIRLLAKDQLPMPPVEVSFRWNVEVRKGLKLGLIPDHVFALEHPGGERAFYFVEADRGTMPVIRHDMSQTSMYRKLLAYAATWKQGVHTTRFRFHRFRVLIVTTGPERVRSLVEACSRLEYGHNLFLFGHSGQLQDGNILTLRLPTGREGETSTLLD